MNLAIEYIQRTKLSQQMLRLPCSLFLTQVFDQSRMVVTIQNCYGKPEELLVKHWRLDRITKDRILPPVEEFIVNRVDMFTSPFIVLDDYNITDYAASPYPIQLKQSADEPYATTQEKQYHECIDRFFNCSENEARRRNWLWKSFATSFFPETMASDFGNLPAEHQRDAIQELCPVPWKGWCMWITQLSSDMSQSPAAVELTFAPLYRERLKGNAKYQDSIKQVMDTLKKSVKTVPPLLNSAWVFAGQTATTATSSWDHAGNWGNPVNYTDS